MEFRKEIQGGNTIMGVINIQMIFKAMRSPKKYVQKKRAEDQGHSLRLRLGSNSLQRTD